MPSKTNKHKEEKHKELETIAELDSEVQYYLNTLMNDLKNLESEYRTVERLIQSQVDQLKEQYNIDTDIVIDRSTKKWLIKKL